MDEEWMEITAEWTGDLTLTARNEAGGQVQMGDLDGRPGVGPMQLVLAALAGCTGMDVVSILKKKRVNLRNFQVHVRGRRAAEHPRIWTDIHVTYLFWGDGIRPSDVEQAIKLSEDKYCSVGAMLRKAARVTSSYQIFPA